MTHKTFRIKREFANLWVEMLVNGGLVQTTGVLQAATGGYCCLGVACETAIGLGLELAKIQDKGRYKFGFESVLLPRQVQEFAGITNMHGDHTDDPLLGPHPASIWNDKYHASFVVIAQLIEYFGEFYA